MIVLDTHTWMWWVADLDRLTESQQQVIRDNQTAGLGVSIISCWEIAKKCALGKLQLNRPVADWFYLALRFPGIVLLPLKPKIVVDTTQLSAPFHRDPADQLIVATARVHGTGLLTTDDRIRQYPHCNTLP